MSAIGEVRRLEASGALDLPDVGVGETPRRWAALCALARADVSTARLAEAHVDACQILAEADRRRPSGRVLGVWASEHPAHTVTGTRGGGRLRLRGSKAFCSGAGLVDDALVTVTTPGGPVLVLVPVGDLDPRRIDTSGWVTPALADVRTAVVDFDGVEVDDDRIGASGWYLDRPGFWHGAVGPAACWGGAAIGLVDHLTADPPREPHGRAHLGAAIAAAWSIEAALDVAGREADAAPHDARAAHRRALVVRHLVDQACATIQDHVARATGPRPLVSDERVIERNAALTVYRRQCHAERDLEALALLVEGERPAEA